MRRVPMWCLLSLVVCLVCWSNLSEAEQNTGAHKAAPLEFKANVHEVLVPVLILDGAGRAVGNLHKSDFQLFDEGRRQLISGFSVQMHRSETSVKATVAAQKRDLAPVVRRPDATVTLNSRRYIALLFDDLHMDGANLVEIQKGIRRTLTKSLNSSDMVAILSTSGRINTGFTRDQSKLQKAASRLRSFTPPSSSCPDINQYEAFLIIHLHDPQALDVVANGGERRPPTPDKRLNEGIARAAAARELPLGVQRTAATLAVIRVIAQQMVRLPGRRILVLITSGFIALMPANQNTRKGLRIIARRGYFAEMEKDR